MNIFKKELAFWQIKKEEREKKRKARKPFTPGRKMARNIAKANMKKKDFQI